VIAFAIDEIESFLNQGIIAVPERQGTTKNMATVKASQAASSQPWVREKNNSRHWLSMVFLLYVLVDAQIRPLFFSG
jgi:hypothetical protein